MTDRFENVERKLDSTADEHPEAWRPEAEGDQIVGEFVRLTTGPTAYGESPIAVLRTKDGRERSVWLFKAVLKNKMAKLRPKPGEMLAIRYLGRKTGANGHTYDNFSVATDRDEARPDWETLEAESEVELPVGPHAPLDASADRGRKGQNGDGIPF